MRRIARNSLPPKTSSYLATRQQAADKLHAQGALHIERRWADARQTQAIKGKCGSVLDILHQMAGPLQRCMYCSDSRGSDIEHFRPKATYPEQAFRWQNMLLCCSACGRFKGDRFPLDDIGLPLFLDPTIDDPWQHLNFLPETGALEPREWRDANGIVQFSARGQLTADIFRLNDEPVQEGLRRTYKQLCAQVRNFLSEPLPANVFLDRLLAEDTRGLLPWCFGPAGRTYPPFAQLFDNHADVWHACVSRLQPAS